MRQSRKLKGPRDPRAVEGLTDEWEGFAGYATHPTAHLEFSDTFLFTFRSLLMASRLTLLRLTLLYPLFLLPLSFSLSFFLLFMFLYLNHELPRCICAMSAHPFPPLKRA